MVIDPLQGGPIKILLVKIKVIDEGGLIDG
jgi:hypothetical protein